MQNATNPYNRDLIGTGGARALWQTYRGVPVLWEVHANDADGRGERVIVRCADHDNAAQTMLSYAKSHPRSQVRMAAVIDEVAHRRYAVIDIASGYVWGVADATSPVEAAQLVDQEIGGEPRTYEEVPRGEVSSATYAVHEAPAGFAVADGRDLETIRVVEEMRVAAFVRATRAAD